MSFEFDIIRSLIEQQQIQDKLVTVPAGDDAAVIQIPEGQELVVSHGHTGIRCSFLQ